MDPKPLISLKNVMKTYYLDGHPVPILKGISLDIYEGEFVAIMGASGSGKSTLMNLIGCLDRPSSGDYKVAGHDVAGLDSEQLSALRCKTFGFVFQRYNLLSTATALENVELPAIYSGLARPERLARAEELLTSLGLGDRLDHLPKQMSGGEQQRVSVARALMNGGRVILADEPTGALDSKSGERVLQLLVDLHKQGHTIVLITHALEVAKAAKRSIVIKDGTILEDNASQQPKKEAEEITFAKKSKLDREAFLNALKMSWRSLKVQGFRTFLTMLGIVIGVGSVVAMLALGNGAKNAVLEQIRAMGTNLIVVRSGAPNVRGSFGGNPLSIEDLRAISELPYVQYAVPELNKQATVRFSENAYQTTVVGTSHEFPLVHEWRVSQGSFFSEKDTSGYAPVAVIGQTVKNNLFQQNDPVGSFFLIGNVPFLVIGIMEAMGASSFGSDRDDSIWLPISTGRARVYGGPPTAGQVFVKVANSDLLAEVQDEISTLLLARHKSEDFNIRNMEGLLETASETQNTLTFFLGSIAVISLVVGGIGVMNIMLVTITERTREIGLRVATGARPFDVMLQFLTEALLICSIGGALGVIVGLGVAWLAALMGSAVEFSIFPTLLAFSFSFVIGLFFGFLPAKKAAALDPVVALSME